MIIYFDENFPLQIAQALSILQKPCNENIDVFNISEVFGRGSKDEYWIPQIGKEESILITQDIKIHQTRQQRELYRKHNLGIIFLKPPSKTGYQYWQMVNKIFLSWDEIKKTSQKNKKPFALIIRPKSIHLEEL